MAFLELKNVRIAGIAAGVPANVIRNDATSVQSSDYDPAAFVELTGVKERHFSQHLTTSDLCYEAAERLIADLGWSKDEIDALFFVSQTADYVLPATSCILQDRLGLSKECYALDISLGCSGWVYGLSAAAPMLAGGQFKKVLVMAGDAKARSMVIKDSLGDPLFGHSGTVTAIEYSPGAEGLKFHLGTDGSGYDAIIQHVGGSRNPITADAIKIEEENGRLMTPMTTRMKGMDVFAFGITTAPKSVKKLAQHFGFDYLEADYFVFHQANMKMNNQIIKKLKLDPARVPSCMLHFGNTSSASIPLTIVTELRGKVEDRPTRFVCCGFGVGLSWGTVAFTTDGIVISELVEVEDPQ